MAIESISTLGPRWLRAAAATSIIAAGGVSAGPSLAQQSPVTWKLHGDQTATFWWSEELASFTKAVEQSTKGSVKLEFYPASALGVAPASILAPVRAGSIEMAEFVASYVANEAPYLTTVGLPMIASSVEHGYRITSAIRPEIAKELAQKYEVVLLATLSSTPLQLFLGKKEFRGIDSLKGLRIRTLGPDQEFFVRSLGSTPVAVSIADLVSSVATNRVDGVIAGTQYIVSQKLSEYGPNLLAWNAVLGPGFLVASQRKWGALTAEQRNGIMEAAKTFEQTVWRRADTFEKEMQEKATASGMTVVRLSEADRKTLVAKAKEAWAGWAQRSGPLARKFLDVAGATK